MSVHPSKVPRERDVCPLEAEGEKSQTVVVEVDIAPKILSKVFTFLHMRVLVRRQHRLRVIVPALPPAEAVEVSTVDEDSSNAEQGSKNDI